MRVFGLWLKKFGPERALSTYTASSVFRGYGLGGRVLGLGFRARVEVSMCKDPEET